MNVQTLKQSGYRVSLTTRRYTMGNKELERISTLRDMGYSEYIDPRGGLVECRIITPKGQELRGEAVCSRKDNFNRKVGNEIALFRALSQEDPNYVAPPYELPKLKLSELAQKMIH